MATANKRLNAQSLGSAELTPSPSPVSATAPGDDSQVKYRKAYAPRRKFDMAYKQRILLIYNACGNASERGALLRREGLYHARIAAWRHEVGSGKGLSKKHRTDHLVRENERLKKKLAQAEAIIELQKKVSELLGTHILPHEINEED